MHLGGFGFWRRLARAGNRPCVKDLVKLVFFFAEDHFGTSVTLLYHSVTIGERLAKEEM